LPMSSRRSGLRARSGLARRGIRMRAPGSPARSMRRAGISSKSIWPPPLLQKGVNFSLRNCDLVVVCCVLLA
jgi:hypothetical protein